MASRKLGQWLSMLPCGLILLKTAGADVGITYVGNAAAKGAVCLDGSPSAYNWDEGFTSGINNCIIEDTVAMFGLMLDEGIGFDKVSFSATLKALSVSALGSLASCTLVHCCAIEFGFDSEIPVSCSSIDAYAKSGHVTLSQQVFEKLPSPNVVCFTSIINGYAHNGMGRKYLQILDIMVQTGLKFDKITSLAVSMKSIHEPQSKHYTCLVDLLGHAGLVDEAKGLLKRAPVELAT